MDAVRITVYHLPQSHLVWLGWGMMLLGSRIGIASCWCESFLHTGRLTYEEGSGGSAHRKVATSWKKAPLSTLTTNSTTASWRPD